MGKAVELKMSLFTTMEVDSFWPQLEALLDRVPHTWRQWTKEEIYEAVIDGRLQVWGIGPPTKIRMVLFTSVTKYPKMKVFTILWSAGTLIDGMIPLLDSTFTMYARIQECTEMEIRGRMGWEPALKDHGFSREAAIWTKPIVDIHLN